MKLRTGEPTERETVTAIVRHTLDKVLSLDAFTNQLKMLGYEVYFRNGVPYGVVGKRKYRFTSLGVLLDKLERGTKLRNIVIGKQRREGYER